MLKITFNSIGNTTYFDPLPEDRVVEDMNFSKPYDDEELRRTNLKRSDPRTDWLANNNENGHDSDVSNRYAGVSLSACIYMAETLCNLPSAVKIRQIKTAATRLSKSDLCAFKDYVQEELDVLEWKSIQGVKTASVTDAIRYYVLRQIIFGV